MAVKRYYMSLVCFLLSCLTAFVGLTNFWSLQGYLFLAAIVLLFFSEVLYRRIKIDKNLILLLAFGGSYNLFAFLHDCWSVRSVVYLLLAPVVVYILGQQSNRSKDRRSLYFLISCCLGMFVSAFSTILNTMKYAGLNLGSGQPLIPLFSGEYMSRTGLSLYLMPICGVSLWQIFYHKFKTNKVLFALSVFVIFFSVYCSSLIGNRAFIMSIGILTALMIGFVILKSKSVAVKIIIFSLLSIGLVFSLLLMSGAVPDFLLKIAVFRRFASGGSNKERLQLYQEFFANFYKYPLGGEYKVLSQTFVHNFILDIYNFAGVVPFSFFVYLYGHTLYAYAKYKAFCFKPNLSAEAVMAVFWAITAIGLFEPLFQANAFTVILFVLPMGTMSSIHNNRPLKANKIVI